MNSSETMTPDQDQDPIQALFLHHVKSSQWQQAIRVNRVLSATEYRAHLGTLNLSEDDIEHRMAKKASDLWRELRLVLLRIQRENIVDRINRPIKDTPRHPDEDHILYGFLKEHFDNTWNAHHISTWIDPEGLAAWEAYCLEQTLKEQRLNVLPEAPVKRL